MVTRGLKSDLSFVRTVFGGNIGMGAGDEFGDGKWLGGIGCRLHYSADAGGRDGEQVCWLRLVPW